MLVDMVSRLSGFGITGKAAMADTWGAAHAFARSSSRLAFLVQPGESPGLLRRLPLLFLRLPGDMVEQLRRLGFERIVDIVGPAPRTLSAALWSGAASTVGSGDGTPAGTHRTDPISRPDRSFAAVRRTHRRRGNARAIHWQTGRGIMRTACRKRRGCPAPAICCFNRVDSEVQAIRIGTAKPNRDVKRLTRLLCDKLETIDPGFGVEAMRLCATLTEPFETKQVRTFAVGTKRRIWICPV